MALRMVRHGPRTAVHLEGQVPGSAGVDPQPPAGDLDVGPGVEHLCVEHLALRGALPHLEPRTGGAGPEDEARRLRCLRRRRRRGGRGGEVGAGALADSGAGRRPARPTAAEDGVDSQGQERHDDHHRTAKCDPLPAAQDRRGPGHAPRREHDVVLHADHLVQAVHELLRIEPELLGVVAQERARVRGAGQRLEALVLERHQILGADLGVSLYLVDAEAEPDAFFAQRGANACHRPTGVYGIYPLRRVLVSTTTKSLPVISFKWRSPASLKCALDAPWTYHSVPLSATMIP